MKNQRKINHFTISLIFCLFTILSLSIIGLGKGLEDVPDCKGTAPDTKDVNVQANWRYVRDMATSNVSLIAATYKPTDQEYKDARKLYDEASASYNAYLNTALLQFVQEQKGDLTPTATKACQSSQQFVKFVDEKTTSKGFAALLPIIKTLIDYGIGFYTQYQKAKKDKRQAIADAIKKDVLWKGWDEIIKPAPKA